MLYRRFLYLSVLLGLHACTASQGRGRESPRTEFGYREHGRDALPFSKQSSDVYVDKGNPYSDGPIETGELTITPSIDKSPKHCKVFFPLEKGPFAVIYFVGGLQSIVLAEFYSIYLKKVAAHGFFVFGVDYDYPVSKATDGQPEVGQDIDIYFQQLKFFQTFMVNKTLAIPVWNNTGLLCHSAGCDGTLKMIEANRFNFKSSAFLEPYSTRIKEPVTVTVPALMYGTELAEVARPFKCNIPGFDYKTYYNAWKCPRIMIEVASFGHCDILDPIPWEGCHATRYCTTTNNTRLNEYRQFAQGVTASFFITMLQGRPDAISYIADQSKATLRLLLDESDLNC